MRFLSLGVPVGVGLVFALSSIAKLSDPEMFVKALEALILVVILGQQTDIQKSLLSRELGK